MDKDELATIHQERWVLISLLVGKHMDHLMIEITKVAVTVLITANGA
jgi:hypothetical protein